MSSELALLERHRAGDQAAFEQIFHQYKDAVYGYLWRCRIPDGARDDLAQEIFIRIHGALDRFVPSEDAGPRPLKAWVFTIVANTVRSYFRRHRPEREPLPFEEAPDHEPSASETVNAKELAHFLEESLHKLGLVERQVLVLFCIEELDQESIAEILLMPVNTVKTHLRRGRLHLAEALERRRVLVERESR